MTLGSGALNNRHFLLPVCLPKRKGKREHEAKKNQTTEFITISLETSSLPPSMLGIVCFGSFLCDAQESHRGT